MPDSPDRDRYPQDFRICDLWAQMRNDPLLSGKLYTADYRAWMVEARGITAGIILN
jgi:hypothetical protein